MKKIIILLLLATGVNINTQGQIHNQKALDSIINNYVLKNKYDEFRLALKKSLKKYKEKDKYGKYKIIEQPALLDSNVAKAFATIITSNDNTVNTGTAFTFSQSNNNATLNLNTSYSVNHRKRSYLNIGITANGKNNIFDIYTNKSWANKIAFSLGFTHQFKASQYFNKDAALKRIKDRKEYSQSVLLPFVKQILKLDTAQLRTDSSTLENLICKQEDFDSIVNQKYFDSLNIIKIKLNNYKRVTTKLCNCKATSIITDSLISYDNRIDSLHGYQVFWWNVNTTFSSNQFQLSDTSKLLRPSDTSRLKFNYSIEGSLNWNHSATRTIQYAQLNAVLTSGSLLDDPTIAQMPRTSKLVSANDSIGIYEGSRLIGTYNDITKNIFHWNLGGYYAIFFFFDKTLGISTRGNINGQLGSGLYRNNFSILAGPLFKTRNIKWASATFGINAGFENVLYHVQVWKFFGIKAYVGIPFRVFDKKEQES